MMLKALALTRKGSLAEATAAIQKALKLVVADGAPPAPAARAARRAANVEPTGDFRPVPASIPLPGPAVPADAAADAARPVPSALRKAPAKHGFLAGSHTFAGATRNYKLFVPASVEAAPRLVVMLHGCTQNPDDFAAGTRMNVWAAREGFLVLYPEQSRNANPSACWNWFQTNDQQRDHGEAGLIASLTRAVIAEHGVDPTRVYVAGLSAGGAMAANLAAVYPDLFAAAAIHSGLVAGAANNVVDALSAMRKGARARTGAASGLPSTPTIVFHGDADRTVHPVNGDQIVSAAFDAGTMPKPEVQTGRTPSGQAYVQQSYRDPDGIARVEQWKLEGAGHAWAGGDAAGTYTDPLGVDATREMLRFFALHRLDVAVAN